MALDLSPAALDEFASVLTDITSTLSTRHQSLSTLAVLPTPASVQSTISSLPAALPSRGLGTTGAIEYLQNTILPGCVQAQTGPRYFGFVTGGVTPAAQLAEVLAGSYDENVQVTLPGQTAATAVEARVLELVLDLIGVERGRFEGRTLTTGATASNVLGMACARDHLYAHSPHLPPGYSLSRTGPPTRSVKPDQTLPYPLIRIFALHPHYSILKAAALVGLGNGGDVLHILPHDPSDPEKLSFDQEVLRKRLQEEKEAGRGVIVVYGAGEVNTGSIGKGLRAVAGICEDLGAWLHVDAAFGGFAAAVPELRHLTDGVELAHSVTLDAQIDATGHKWLNVPYDTGLFYTRKASSLPGVFAPAEAPAYLTAPSGPAVADRAEGEVVHELVPSPLYVNIENSRRFRALPLLASLMALGKDGYADIVRRNIIFARQVATFIHAHPSYDLLNYSPGYSAEATIPAQTESFYQAGIVPLNIVLFAPSPTSHLHASAQQSGKDAGAVLAAAINGTREMYVTGTKWMGRGAVRLAVSNWRTGLAEGAGQEGQEGDLEVVKRVLEGVSRQV